MADATPAAPADPVVGGSAADDITAKPETATQSGVTQQKPVAEKPAVAKPAEEKKSAPKTEKQLTPEQREAKRRRRGALSAGALAMPIITLGATLMAVPLGIWYVSTVFKTIIVVITNMVTGQRQAQQVNGALNNVDPDAMSSISLALIIVGAVLVIAALLISYLMLRAHDVDQPLLVTTFSMPMASVIAAVVTASIGALGGLLFRSATETVSGILGNAALGIAAFALAAIAVSVVIGGVVWWWVATIFRRLDVQTKK